MILGLPVTDTIGFEINEFLVNNNEALNGVDLNHPDALVKAGVRRFRHAQKAAGYVSIPMEPPAPLDYADPWRNNHFA